MQDKDYRKILKTDSPIPATIVKREKINQSQTFCTPIVGLRFLLLYAAEEEDLATLLVDSISDSGRL